MHTNSSHIKKFQKHTRGNLTLALNCMPSCNASSSNELNLASGVELTRLYVALVNTLCLISARTLKYNFTEQPVPEIKTWAQGVYMGQEFAVNNTVRFYGSESRFAIHDDPIMLLILIVEVILVSCKCLNHTD